MEPILTNGVNGEIELESSEAVANGVEGSVNGIPVDGNSVEKRVKRKAKRLFKQYSKEAAVVTNGAGGLVTTPRTWKNTRRPRNGFGRGLPKKGGAGGKGVWGKLGSELVDDVDMDSNDPNYDSDSLENGDIELKKIIPEVSDDELRTEVEPIIQEYFLHGDTNEACLSLEDVNTGAKRYMIAVIAIETAMDHKPSHREMTSVLISDLYGRLLSTRDVSKAFDALLKNLPDLTLDTPDAATILGNFLARAIADDCIPPKAISSYKEKMDSGEAKVALTRADTLLSMKHGLVRLDNVWGVGGGLRPVKYLISQMNLLLKEFLSSSDQQEATRCLLDLEVPHFHHELVYEAVIMVIEAINGQTEEMMCKLLKSLYDAVIITPDMMERGFFRVFDDMPDICLDVPLAYSVLERFTERCSKAAILTDEIIRRIPSRGRKRFVSEGDGGRIKEHHI